MDSLGLLKHLAPEGGPRFRVDTDVSYGQMKLQDDKKPELQPKNSHVHPSCGLVESLDVQPR